MGSRAPLMTAEELLLSDVPNMSTELVRGVPVVREPPGTWHGQIAAKLLYLLGQHVYPDCLGALFSQDTGFLIARDPDTVRAADVSFVRVENAGRIGKRGYSALAPDLVIEILSPGDRPVEGLEKVTDWLRAGVHLVWVIDSERQLAQVYRPDGAIEFVRAGGTLGGGAVLPGLDIRISEILT